MSETKKRSLSVGVLELTRPESATVARLSELACPCVTLKLDGVRCALLAEDGRWRASLAGGASKDLAWDAPSEPCALDAESVGEHYYVFDALEVRGIDVRQRPLLERLCAARSLQLPPAVVFKRFSSGYAPELGLRVSRMLAARPVLADGRRLDCAEGVMLADLTAAYETAPLKFKPRLTHDFLVAAVGSDSRKLRLHVQFRGELQPFRHGLASHLLELSAAEVVALLPRGRPPVLADGVILECFWTGQAWRAQRPRGDRTRPNTASTVLENLRLQASGLTEAGWLVRQLPRWESARPRAFLRLLEAAGRLGLEARPRARLLVLPRRAELLSALAQGDVVVVAASGLEHLKGTEGDKALNAEEVLTATQAVVLEDSPALRGLEATSAAIFASAGNCPELLLLRAARRLILSHGVSNDSA